MNNIIDFHTHAFPDPIAEKAMDVLHSEIFVKAALDGKLSSLLASMDRAGIQKSVLASIATRPSQFDPILQWSRQVASDRILPFPSVHPDDPDAAAHIRQIADAGFRGIKMHPYYQDFFLDEDRIRPIYDALCETDLMLLMHTGYDIAFEFIRRCDPPRIVDVLSRWPDLKLITTHLGAWMQWEEVRDLMIGKPIYIEISYSLTYLPIPESRKLLLAHRPEYLLFGTDSPWDDQAEAIERLHKLDLPPNIERRILHDNAAELLA